MLTCLDSNPLPFPQVLCGEWLTETAAVAMQTGDIRAEAQFPSAQSFYTVIPSAIGPPVGRPRKAWDMAAKTMDSFNTAAQALRGVAWFTPADIMGGEMKHIHFLLPEMMTCGIWGLWWGLAVASPVAQTPSN